MCWVYCYSLWIVQETKWLLPTATSTEWNTTTTCQCDLVTNRSNLFEHSLYLPVSKEDCAQLRLSSLKARTSVSGVCTGSHIQVEAVRDPCPRYWPFSCHFVNRGPLGMKQGFVSWGPWTRAGRRSWQWNSGRGPLAPTVFLEHMALWFINYLTERWGTQGLSKLKPDWRTSSKFSTSWFHFRGWTN